MAAAGPQAQHDVVQAPRVQRLLQLRAYAGGTAVRAEHGGGPQHVEPRTARAPLGRRSGTSRCATGTHSRASGTLTRKTQRQPGPSTGPPPRERPDSRADAAETGPQPPPGPGRPGGGGLDQGGRAGGEPRAADSLQCPGSDRSTPPFGAHPHCSKAPRTAPADHDEPPPSEAVANGTAEQNQPSQRGHGRGVLPLEHRAIRVLLAADARQGDVDDGGVQQGHAGAAAGRAQQPPGRGPASRRRARAQDTASPVAVAPGSTRTDESSGLLPLRTGRPQVGQASTTRVASPAAASPPQVRGS
ncbi:hypothetical protein SGLAM104S_01087 [Streptomyces glaucescens]